MSCRTILVSVLAIACLSHLEASHAADAAAGKAEADKACAACHDPADWKGKTAAQLETQIKSVVAAKVKHPKKIALTDAQIADIAAYWAAGAT